ncbi:protein of unknown function duf221, partial [Chrysochromulina tobinii]
MLEEDDALKVTIENDPTAGAFDDGSATYTSLRFSAEADWALLRALVIALVAIVFSTLFYIAARKSRVLRKHVFAPMVAEGAGGPDAFPGVCGWWAEVALEIGRIVGEGEVLQIATIAELRAGESGFLTSQSLPRLGEKASLLKESLKQKLPARLHRNFEKLEEGSSDALHQARTLASLVCCGEVEPRSASFVVLFRSRRAAATAVALARWPGEMLSAPGYVRVLPAPAPADIYWPNLLLTRERRAMHWYVGLAWTIALYLLFNLPVAFIQGLSSIRTLSKVPGLSCISDYIGSMGPAAVASFQGIAASLVLQASLYFTLYSGLFQLLSRMAGAISHTQICEWSAQRIMLFQIIFVILVSSITSSAFDTLGVALENPIDVPYLLAGTLPSQSSFFMHYLLNQILFAYLLEGAQLITLCTFVICKLSRRRPKAAKQPAADRPVANEPAAVPPTPSAPLS